MKKIICICSALIAGFAAHAAFYATNLPSVAGEYNCSYFSTNNTGVPTLLTLITNVGGGTIPAGTTPTWDFSQAKQSQETILRTDIIPATNGMDGGSFPAATYSEQDSSETLTATNQTAWRYYSITNQGRIYYGSYVPNTGADGVAVFQPPTLDIPAVVTNGQTWSRTTAWNTELGYYSIYYEFSDISIADAQGTLILPNLGSFVVFRVHEVHSYLGLLNGSIPYEAVTNQYYYWLVPGLGVAAQVTIYGNYVVDGSNIAPPFTNSVERMYFANYYAVPTNSLSFTPGNLHIQSHGGGIGLFWLPFTNTTSQIVSTGYQVQAISSPAGTNWQLLGLTSGTNWSDALSSTQRFYRVVGFP